MNIAIILAAGSSQRFKGKEPKQFALLENKALFLHSLEKFLLHQNIDKTFLVINPEYQEEYKKHLKHYKPDGLIIGGKTRKESVLNALKEIAVLKPNKVLIHDAARPFVSFNLISNILAGLNDKKTAIVPGIEVADTLRKVSGTTSQTIDRDNVYNIQTPQGFFFQDLYFLHQEFADESITDDARLYELNKAYKCKIISGEKSNYKITLADDLVAYQNNDKSSKLRIGFGTDIHKFLNKEEETEIKIAGVNVKHNKAIDAHSDGDVVLHALVDALLGTCGLGDIGEFFPDTDPKFKNHDSEFFVKVALAEISKHNVRIINIDVIINCERPKLQNYKALMQQNLARILNIPRKQINIKAKTNEKLDAIGEKKAISASVSLLAQITN